MRKLLPLVLVLFALMGCGDSAEPEASEKLNATDEPEAAKELNATAKLMQKAEAGDADAQYYLGIAYYFGEGVPQDSKEAVKWYRKAAEQGNASALLSIGVMYDESGAYDYKEAVIVLKNNKEAVKWFRKSAEQGHALAQLSLGVMYEWGYGVPKDNVNAYAWYDLAASNGHNNARSCREIVAKTMTPEQIGEAQKLSKELLKKIEANKAAKE